MMFSHESLALNFCACVGFLEIFIFVNIFFAADIDLENSSNRKMPKLARAGRPLYLTICYITMR